MIAAEFLSPEIIPLKVTDKGHAALIALGDYYVKHLPIVSEKKLIGVLSEQDIFDNPIDDEIGTYHLILQNPRVSNTDHLFEIMRLMAENNLTAIPVVDQNDEYLGVITQESLIHFYATSFSFAEPGGILVLELNRSNYSLSEISRLVESENAQILSSFITSKPDSEEVLVTLKLNRTDLNRIQATLERFDYEIYAAYTEVEYLDALKERYDSLINYLNV
jgi:acetoin utilization protein AcuB